MSVGPLLEIPLPGGLETSGQRAYHNYLHTSLSFFFYCFNGFMCIFFSFWCLQISLICIVGELAGGGSVAVSSVGFSDSDTCISEGRSVSSRLQWGDSGWGRGSGLPGQGGLSHPLIKISSWSWFYLSAKHLPPFPSPSPPFLPPSPPCHTTATLWGNSWHWLTRTGAPPLGSPHLDRTVWVSELGNLHCAHFNSECTLCLV